MINIILVIFLLNYLIKFYCLEILQCLFGLSFENYVLDMIVYVLRFVVMIGLL